ncbi:MAG: DUF3558 domain-containing protein [Actinophytocola sp.]|uniref:DUF3558 domain-containing protein n=1 Tax=Actinophytocola sp. TaxID=1872138 RepID=UPI003C729D0F
MNNRLLRIAIIAVSAIGLAACTTTAAGNPIPDQVKSGHAPTSEPPSTDENPPGDELPSDGAPKVENPLDVSHFEQNPCDALTPQQANTLNVEATGTRADTNFGNGCMWRNPETGGSAIISFLSKAKRGLSDTYRSNKNGEFKYFEPIDDIEGFPAVAWDTDSESPTNQCSVTVGITDQLSMQTLTELSSDNIGQKDPCEVGVTVTGEFLTTISLMQKENLGDRSRQRSDRGSPSWARSTSR